MLRAVGFGEDDWGRTQVGVASLPLDRLANRAKAGVGDAGGVPLESSTGSAITSRLTSDARIPSCPMENGPRRATSPCRAC